VENVRATAKENRANSELHQETQINMTFLRQLMPSESSNVEVKYRVVEMARIFNFDRVNRIHRARDDSGQNEAERSNACIGEALVDGGTMRWQYYKAFDGLTEEEIQAYR
jgi:hypothetical protein